VRTEAGTRAQFENDFVLRLAERNEPREFVDLGN